MRIWWRRHCSAVIASTRYRVTLAFLCMTFTGELWQEQLLCNCYTWIFFSFDPAVFTCRLVMMELRWHIFYNAFVSACCTSLIPIIFYVYLSIFLPFSSAIQHPSYGDCLEVKREYYQNCSVLGCVTQCLQSAAHSCEQFLQVQQIGFVTLGPLRHA